MKKLAAILILIQICIFNTFTQEKEVKEELALPKVTETKVNAILPKQDPNLIFIEGEDATATNFNKEPILNFSCSGFKTLQLNQSTELQGNTEYYADFVFFVEQDGVYEFWYGGTPPGLKDETLPSFSSPFTYVIDGFGATDVYRENTHVVETYAPAYYWNLVSDITLQKGQHRLKIKVNQKRSHDNRYYLYMDNLFFVKKNGEKRVTLTTTPKVFPKNMDNRSIDSPFKSLEDYEIAIRENPEIASNYVELSLIYTLIGDYLKALKYLRRASFLEPNDPEIMLLIAKNTMWKGDIYTGLDHYRELLEYYPERIDLWTEAGKVAAWSGLYDESIIFFEEAIKQDPKNVSLIVNLGMTYLWSGDVKKAESYFLEAKKSVKKNIQAHKDLALIYEINNDYEYATQVYTDAIQIQPEEIELYFLLENAYRKMGETDKILKLRKIVEESFIKTPDLSNLLKTYYTKQSMKDEIILEFENQLKREPDNLLLRRNLAELYFWNGFRKGAIREYLNIITNEAYRNINETEKASIPFLELMDRNHAYLNYLNRIPTYITLSLKELTKQLNAHKLAIKTLEAKKKIKKQPLTEAQLLELENKVNEEELKLSSMIAAKQAFLDKFETLLSQYEDEQEHFSRLKETENSQKEIFKNLIEGTNWKWDKKALVDELELVKKNGLRLAPYILGRIELLENDASKAKSNYADIVRGTPKIPGTEYGYFQSQLWQGNDKEYKEIIKLYENDITAKADYFPELLEYLDFLSLEDEDIIGFLTESAETEILNLNKSFSKIRKDSLVIKEKVNKNINELRNLLHLKMERDFFQLSQNTYLLRNQLGDFYQLEKKYPEAILQFKQVLSVDPWNLDATYKLGQAYQNNGNWNTALKLYEEVYWQDPFYANAASNYNAIAKDHADTFSFTGSSISDKDDFVYTTATEYLTRINGVYSMAIDYNTFFARDFKDDTDLNPGSYFIQNPMLKFLINISSLNIKITPFGGIYTGNYYIDQEYEPAAEEVTLGDYTEKATAYPVYGGTMNVSIKNFGFNFNYEQDWEKDTFLPNRESISFSKLSGDLAASFKFMGKRKFKDSNARIYAYNKTFSDSNSAFGGNVEFMINYNAMLKPDISIQLYGNVSYEDSSERKTTYWTPNQVLSITGGIGTRMQFPVSNKKTITESLRFSAGPYEEKDSSDTTIKSTNYELENTIEYSNDNLTYYFKMLGSVKNQSSPVSRPMDYWSFSTELGVIAKLPSLLVQ